VSARCSRSGSISPRVVLQRNVQFDRNVHSNRAFSMKDGILSGYGRYLDCNGVALARDFDIFTRAGGSNRALVQTFHGLQPEHRAGSYSAFCRQRSSAW
jgi:hypothetical protein